MLEDWRELFHFYGQERRAIVKLLVILVALWVAALVLPALLRREAPFAQGDATGLFAQWQRERAQDGLTDSQRLALRYDTLELFRFDPNTASLDDWQRLGLESWQARGIQNYLARGGQFRRKPDLKRMDAIDDQLYAILEPYIDLPEGYSSSSRSSGRRRSGGGDRPREDAYELFEFDPNTASLDDWRRLGLSQRQAQAVVNYRSSGAVFRQPEDLLRVSVISPEKKEELLPYVRIAEAPGGQEPSGGQEPAPVARVDVGTADALELEGLRGIGPVLAERVVRYRELLGGFHALEQLREVQGLSEETYQGLLGQVELSPGPLRQLSLNVADFSSLLRHPYIEYDQVRNLFDMRQHMGEFTEVDQARRVFEPEVWNKVKHYLSL